MSDDQNNQAQAGNHQGVEPVQQDTEEINQPDERQSQVEKTLLAEQAEQAEKAQETADKNLNGEESEETKVKKNKEDKAKDKSEETTEDSSVSQDTEILMDTGNDDPNVKWYVVHTYSGHENKVATALKQRIEAEHLEHKILDILVPTQEKIEIRGGKKETVKEKIFPGYILVKMILDDNSWLAVRTTQGVTSFVGIGNKPTPIPEAEVKTIVKFMRQGTAPTFKDVFLVDDTVKIIDGPFSEFIGKVDSVDKEHGKVRVLVSIFGRETPVELDFLQVQKL